MTSPPPKRTRSAGKANTTLPYPKLLHGSAFITGAGSGIGRATALAFACHGIEKLALADIDDKNLIAVEKELETSFPDVQVLNLHVNVRELESVESGLARTVDEFGRLDVAVNGAGVTASPEPTHERTEEEWMRVLDINLHGVWRCQREELKIMLRQEDLGPRDGGRGIIVNIASILGLIALPGGSAQGPYIASKHGVLGLTKADASTYGPHNIRINAICPGWVDTPLIAHHMVGGENAVLAPAINRVPLRRVAQPDEIADSIVYLASPLASYVQGSGVVADGAYSIV